ncbi:MAG: DUF6326 family protein [Candidatus Hodarchaeales archaeon]|jgi:hypothetical protein
MTDRLVDVKINVKIKLAATWATIMFLFIYADFFGFWVPGFIDELRVGEVAGLQITPVILLVFMILMTIPSLMVFLSLTLKAKANRWTNIIVGISQIGIVLASAIGDPNIYWIFAHGVEAVLLSLIVWYAWKWPTQEG